MKKKTINPFAIIVVIVVLLALAFGAVWHHTDWVRPYLKPDVEQETTQVTESIDITLL